MNARTMFRPTFLSTLALTAALAAGCGKSDEPSCDQVVDHVAKLAEMEVTPETRGPMIANCKKEPASRRACALKAKTITDVAACR